METGNVTTPFGRRSMTLGMLANQVMAGEIKPDQSVDKWKLFRALCEAKPLLGIGDRALAVLNALLSFYPKNELAQENGLIVFPSNIQLSLRTHGMAEQTVRRHLAALVEAGLLLRKDSPNGKRYVRRDRAGEVNEAFGFSLAPLLARAEEIEQLAAEVMAERLHVQRLRERITLCRRDIAKLIEAAVEEQIPGDWQGLYGEFRDLIEGLPRTPTAAQLELLLHELEALREDILNRLEIRIKSTKQRGNANYIERHIQNSNPESTSELEPSFETKQGAVAEQDKGREAEMLEEGRGEAAQIRQEESRQSGGRNDGGALKSFPLGLVLQACPEILAYGPDGVIRNWRDLMAAAVIVRSMLGVSPSAYEEAANVMGPENAATVMACILERGGHINSAGGYLRGLTRRSEKGEFAIGPMLMALLRANAPAGRKAG
ncbi:replication initiation protein RepC [Rhizobium leguminosarum bv. viciae]|uniref:plasmid replication protein RepC n=1 Tax=Rhizobium TaxID=379 RepID=UPI00103D693F|nr:plasmid replication protein RepC [Rhizobium leguminosarum]MBY5345073.1 replication initiation protein RepC [Rhizobium leguminosarum]MBY5427965.1 replication initiation protein RepC [Rhizobium leguminosarum]NKK52211.1 replication initiation protein RepC [Rhizobium leguminosarum bv. viciae]QIO69995.1 replication initiation protein RepC [Rhizobium leguminosarum bv. trifolii]TBY96838.1 replication initiation protein RepC [Rhizobium leguminosarum bv. viciae]